MNSYSLTRRGFIRTASSSMAALSAVAATQPAFAQDGPDQLHILVGFGAGSFPDTLSRIVAEQLGAAYPRRVLVENRPGAAGLIAVNALKAAPADGSTVMLASGTVASAYPYLYEKLSYDPMVDLKPVSLAAEVTLGLAVGTAVPSSVGNVGQLLEWMRANPTRANVASPGAGTPPHLLEAMLFRQTGVEWQHVSYPGGPPAVGAVLAGQVAALVLPEGLLRSHQVSGKLRVLATSGAQRSRYLPEVPTFVEQGYANLVVVDWFAFFMSGNVSTSAVEAASQKLRTAIARPELVATLSEASAVAVSSTPSALAARISADQRYWGPVIRENHIRIE